MFKKKNLMEELIQYIKKNLKKGYTRESLRWALIEQGYSRIEIDKAMKRTDEELAKKAPVLKTKPEISYELIEPQINLEPQKKSFWDFFRK